MSALLPSAEAAPRGKADRADVEMVQRGVLRCNNTPQKLESAIFNAVSLGQWEIARAHFTTLTCSGDATSRENARELLKLLIMEASKFWSDSVAIPTPHHLSWLALQTYISLFHTPEEQLPEYVGKLIEFRLLLCSVLCESSSSAVSVSSNLCRYHATHVLSIPGTTSEPVSPFQSAVLSFLHNVLVSKPVTGHALIRSLTVPDSSAHLVNNEVLQLLYMEAIQESLEAMLQLKLPEAIETDSDSQYESDHTWTTMNQGRQSVTKECQRLTNLVYDLLSLVDPQPDMSRVSIDKLLVYLLELNHELGPDKLIRFEAGSIYSCLLGRSSPYLIKRLHNAEEYVRLKGTKSNGAGGKSSEWSLKLVSETSSPLYWRGLFYHAYHDHKHFLECVMDIGLQLIRMGRLKEVSELLSKPEYTPLRPILLLLGWDVYVAEGSGKELTDALWPSQVSLSQPLLYEGCCRLAFQVELVQWCLDKARPHLLPPTSQYPPSSSSTSTRHHTSHRAGDMFKGLENHSVLYILHHYTPLEALDPLEVVEILKHRPRLPALSTTFTPPPQFSRGPTPHKPPLQEDTSSPTPRRLQPESKLKPEQERDISIFRSFRAMKLVLDALWVAVQINNGIMPERRYGREEGRATKQRETKREEKEEEEKEETDQAETTKKRVARKLEFGSGNIKVGEGPCKEDEAKETNVSLGTTLYAKEVLERLQEAKVYISLLYPLNYRLEILENIFSLLFLTSEDVRALRHQDEIRASSVSSASERHRSNSAGLSESSNLTSLLQSDCDFSATLSSVAIIRSRHGFLINEKVAGDLLSVLQDSMFEMRAARFVLTQPAASRAVPTLQPSAIRSSISPSSAQQRAAKLEQYINEARWRLQLVSSKHGIETGKTSSRTDGDGSKKWVEFSSSGESGSEVSESDTEPEDKPMKGVKRKQPRKASSDRPKSPTTHLVPELELVSLISDRPPPSITSRSTTSDKIPTATHIQTSLSSVHMGSSTAHQLSHSVPSSSHFSSKLGNRLNSRQRSPHSSVESRNTPSDSPHDQCPHPGEVEDSGECADVEEKLSPQQRKRKKRLRSRSLQAAKKRRMKLSGRTDAGSAYGSVVSQMLASPASLLRMCLKYTNYSRAYEVIKMFGMEGQFGEAFVHFSEKYELVRRELADRSRTVTPKHSPSLTPQDTGRSNQQSSSSSSLLHPDAHLHVAIANATNSSSALESLHHLLAPSSLHRMLLSGHEQLERSAQDAATLPILIEHVPTLVMLDIVCSTRIKGQVVKRIVEEASSRCQPILESLFTKSHTGSQRTKRSSLSYDATLPGPFSLLQLFSEVSGYFTADLPQVSSPHPSHTSTYHSPHTLLSSFPRTLRTTSIMNHKTFEDSYRKSRDRLAKILERDTVVNGDIIVALTQSNLDLVEPQRSLSHSLRHQRNMIDTMFDGLMRVLERSPRTPVVASSPKQRGMMRRASSLVLSPGSPLLEVGGVRTNFVFQFSHYLSQLMDLLLKCLLSTVTDLSEATLLLSILQESPSRLLGRLVFEVGVAPQRLEKLMSSFHHIHMMEVLVRCCCPQLPANTIPASSHKALPGPVDGVMVLNEGECEEDSTPTNLCAFSEKLLTNLLSILREHKTPSSITDSMVSTDELFTAYNSPKMKLLLKKTYQLSSVDLQTLGTTADQISFYSNVVNFLYVHCIMVCVAEEQEVSGAGVMALLCNSHVSLTELQRSPLLQVGVFSRMGYRLGQLGIGSCHDLHHCILRRGLSAPAVGRDSPLRCRIAPLKPDPWAQFSPSPPDPRVLFVIHTGPLSSPLPVPLHPDDLVSSLNAAERRYLTQRIRIDVATKEVKVPQSLYNHRDDFGRPLWKDKYSTSYLPDLSLLSYIQTHIAREQSELLQPLVSACEAAMTRKVPLPVKVLIRREKAEFGYMFTMATTEEGHRRVGSGDAGSGGSSSMGTSGPQSPIHSPRILRKRLSLLRGSQTDIPETVETSQVQQPSKGYTFTPEILTFVTHQNPLLAALIHLLCPPPPSPPSMSLTASTTPRKVTKGGASSEEEGTTGIGTGSETTEEEKEDSSLRATIFGLRGSRARPHLPRRTSYDHLSPLSPSVFSWQRELDDILIQFVTHGPMQRFLQARLGNFNSVLPWVPPGSKPSKQSQKMSSSFLHEPKESLRSLALLPSRGNTLGEACSFSLHRLIESGRVQDAVNFLSSEPASCHRDRMYLLADIALSSAFVERYSEILALGQSGESANNTFTTMATTASPLTLLFQLSDVEMATHLVLTSLHNWPVDTCHNLLSFCSNHLPPSSPLLPTIKHKLERIDVYSNIMATCKNPLFSRSAQDTRRERNSWTRWTDLASDSETKTQYVLDILLAEKAFDLARKWAHVHNISQSITQQIEVDYLSALLEGYSPDPMTAHRVLDSLVGDRLRLRVCVSVLEQKVRDAKLGSVDHVETIIFILHYILSKLNKSLESDQRIKYVNWLLGAKALLFLPPLERAEYRSMIEDAALLVEQLLINKKTELAAVVVKELRQDQYIGWLMTPDLPKQKNAPVSLPKDETEDLFTSLIIFYAGKTLEFPEPIFTGNRSYSASASSTAQSTRPTSPGVTSHHSTVPLSPIYTDPPSRMPHTHRKKRSSQRPFSPTSAWQHHVDSSHHYEPPPAPPSKEQWEPNTNATHCRVCRDTYFGMFNRRHHCRRCGRVVCARCSPYLSQVEGYGEQLQRICKNCHSSQRAASEEGGLSSSEYQSSPASVYPSLSHSPLQRWKLIPNDNDYNDNIRSEFYYEESPSSTLCLTLVDLLMSPRLAAAYLLDRCHTVSLQLVPDTHGRVNQEIDHYFVIGLVQNLLWNAKLRFEEATDLSGVEICDTYLSRVDLLRQLVSSRSHIIPSIQELAKPELARRVRDRLVQEDQFEMAMEVSTKCQLDTSVVWSAWGMACLRCGQLDKAREKLKHCFQINSQRGAGVSAGRRGSSVASVQLLERIVDHLEQNPLSITTKNTEPTEDWSSVMVSCMALTERHSDDCSLDTHRFAECLHYIQSYGTPTTAVTFFVRHNCWTDACKYILDEKCTEELFVEQLWIPALKAGVIEKVQDILKALNHSLVQWEPYLTAVCRYLSQRSLYHVLYQTQLYMRDFIRAGMTCIKFFIGFSGRATTISDLFSRRHYLTTAHRHFKSALDAKQQARDRPPLGGGGGRGRGIGYQRGGAEDIHPVLATSIKNMSVTDLKNHISTIALQMKVTEFMYQCSEASGTLRTPLTTSGEGGGANNSGGVARKPPQPITLFSSGHTRAEVAVQLMLSSQDILEGFDLAQQIITTYRLPPGNILSETSRGLATNHRHGDIRVLLECVSKSSFASASLSDDILMAAIRVLASHSKETKQIEKLVQLLTDDRSKIKALIQCGRLKNAYLIAIKSRLIDEVRNISQIAEKAGQLAVRDICDKWLLSNSISHQ